ncbi:MAG: nitrate reductase cytochrome c-type subunit; periplasmic nitrate reductase electron transfer subunit [bacterium]|nr:nitrate reductase cytochrome c-type subunit; periplasmic nitrate reductase electron transfer subunit [bacterium]
MRKILIATVAGLFIGLFGLAPAIADSAPSLRGTLALNDGAKKFDKKRVVTKEGGFKRSWKLQPPSIPHKISKERINLDENSCMRCHSAENFKKEKAKKIGDSHFVDAMGKKSDKVNGRRYFCTLCHTTQVDASPLVENTFAGQ